MRLEIHKDVLAELRRITAGRQEKYGRILLDLKDLQLEPEPSAHGWRMASSRVRCLCQQNYKIRKLTLKVNLPNYRLFYLYDAAHDFISVLEIARRNKSTYSLNAAHIQRAIAKYQDFYRRQPWTD